MKKLLNMLRLDLKLILKDKIALYMVLAPTILSLVFLAVTGNMSEGTSKLAVSADLPQEMIEHIERVADIEIFDSYDLLEKRVKAADSIAGVYMKDGEPAILVEGNESKGFAESNALLVNRVLYGNPVNFESVKVETTENTVLTISMASVLLLAILIAGAVSGFNIVKERENGVIRAIAVSPTGLLSFLGTRILTSLMLGIFSTIISVLLMGKSELTPEFILIALSSLFIYGLVALFLGSFADNQISAFAAMKVIMPVFLMIPIVSVFVSEKLRFLFYPLPMYWQYESIVKALNGDGSGFSLLMILLTGGIWFTIVLILRKKAFNIRMEGVK